MKPASCQALRLSTVRGVEDTVSIVCVGDSLTGYNNLSSAAERVRSAGRSVVMFNVPNLNATCFGKRTAARSRLIRAHHNTQLAAFCAQERIPLADVCSRLVDSDFADALHPNQNGALIIADAVCGVLGGVL